VSFHIPGEIVDLQLLHLSVADHYVETVTSANAAWIPKVSLTNVTRRRPALAEALWRDSLIDASIFREWVLNVGRRDAISRVAHMLCELSIRCQSAGLCSADNFEWPMSAAHIADATALSPQHVGRTLRSLSNAGAVEVRGGHYRVRDWAQLKLIAGFDDAYLHAVAG
jgi:CRP-like cAMP-binding protein